MVIRELHKTHPIVKGQAGTQEGGCSAALNKLASQHPCFALGKPNNKGRIHLPVSPGCNIACRFCERSINAYEQRPGVTAEVIRPDEVVELVGEAVALAPELTVVGIAGPGDTLATPYAIETFRLVKEQFPQLLRCMSTNGLLLEDRIEELVEVGVDTLTVTVNEVDPTRLVQINDYVVYEGRQYRGIEAAELLISKQLAGIRAAAARGLMIKVNTVLVPGINDRRIGVIAQTVKAAGAGLYNLIPLIPNAQMSRLAAPTCAQIDAARSDAEAHIAVFRHCQHCRADAIGVPGGKDYGDQIWRRRVSQANTFSHG
ncbi:MAG: radical SAM protein [Coriobacteriales bacterium]|jgi:nitrogen fixation protein NifB|nr:radical SAM protein [Coriobacteriales bacterium]